MAQNKKDEIVHDHNHDGIDRRGFLKCMAWAGTGALCVMQGGVLKSLQPEPDGRMEPAKMARRTELRANQRQPHGIQQAGESGCCWQR